VLGGVKDQVSGLEMSLWLYYPATRQRSESRKQHLEREWFGQVVVSARVETGNNIFWRIARRKHKNWILDSQISKPLNKGESIQIREHNVKNKHVMAPSTGRFQTVQAVESQLNCMSSFFEALFQLAREPLIVLNNQYVHFCFPTVCAFLLSKFISILRDADDLLTLRHGIVRWKGKNGRAMAKVSAIRTVSLAFILCACASGQTLKRIGAIDLPGPKGQRFDYLAVDDEDHWLLSGHLGPGLLYVIDVQTNKLVKTIGPVPGITGLAYIPGLRKVYTSDWGEEKIGIVDLHSFTVVKRLPTASKPNGITYAAPFKKVYVVNTLGKAVSVIDMNKDEVVKTIQFKSETGTPEYDFVTRRIFVSLRTTNEVAEIDPATDTVVGVYPVSGCQYDHGMAVDAEHHRAFLLCGGNRTLTVFALDTHRAVAHLPLAQGADVVKYDAGLGRIYAACSSGVIGVYHEDDTDHYRKLEDFPVQPLVHSLAIDTATHRVYAPEERENGTPVARMIVYEAIQK
jgi:DNA-binding beta-propeller fold protein YncE